MNNSKKHWLSHLPAILAIAILVIAAVAIPTVAQVPATTTEGLTFTLNEDASSYRVTGYFGTSGEIVIPAKHLGLPVTSIKENIFLNTSDFAGSNAPDGAIIMPGDTLIAPAEKIVFLSTDIQIPDNADALPKDAVICGYTGSSAHQYAQKYARTFEKLARPTILKANVELGADITVNYTVDLAGYDAQKTVMRFTVGDYTTDVIGRASGTAGQYVFSFCGIGPHMMGDNIGAELLVDGTVLHSVDTYSVRQYCLNMLTRIEKQNIPNYDATQYALLRTLIADLLQYGADAQVYASYNTDALVNQGITGMSTYTSPAEEYANVSVTPSTAPDNTHLFSAAVELSNTIRLRFSFATADVSKVTVKIGGVTFDRNDFINTKTTDENGLPIYVVYSRDIYATQIEGDFDVALYVDGTKCQSLTYSVLNYVYRKQNDANTALAALVKSIHCYGLSARNFHSYEPVSIAETKYDTDDVIIANVNVTKYPYFADPTGKEDSTAIIQKALDDTHALGGGTVYMPAGQYLVTDTISVPEGCLLIGDWQDPDLTASPKYGTIILAKPDVLDEKYLADRTRDPLISLDTNSSVEGLTFYYPNQDVNNIQKYGFTLYSHTPSCITISNVTLLNSYRGIGINVHYEQACELVQIDGVRMTALEIGYEFYRSSEVGNTVDFRMSPSYWAKAGLGFACNDAATLASYCRANTVGMQFNGLDDGHFSELYLEGLRTAMYLPVGYCGNYFWGLVYDLTVENCINGVVIEQLNGMGGMAIAKATIDADKAAVYSTATQGSLKLCGVDAKSGDIVAVGSARIYVDDTTDISSYEIASATYTKPASYLYIAPVLEYSYTKTDVSSLIQQTLDKAAATGGVVYLPAGVYTVDRTLSVPAGVELRGSAPIFMRDSQTGADGIFGTVLITYVADDATVKLAESAGVNGLRIICGVYDPYDARDMLAASDPITQNQFAIKGEGSGVYAHNVVLTTTFNGIDFRGCDNHSIKHAFGAVYRHFIVAGGENGVIEQCLTNQHFLDRQHLLSSTYLKGEYASKWTTTGARGAVFRDEVRRAYGIMVYLEDAVNEKVSNVFTYGPYTLILCDNTSAELLNVSSDFHGMGPMFNVKNDSDVVAVNVLRSANESMSCDTSSSFKLINRTAISRFNEPSFVSAKGQSNTDELIYTVKDKVMLNDGTTVVSGTTAHTGAYTKTGGNSLYHAASTSTNQTVTLYSQTFSSSINAASYAGSDAYLHMWVYVEDMTSSIWTGYITLTGTGASISWSTICYITHNGWNELWLPMTGTSGVAKSGSFSRLTITDYRSVLVEHSDYYFDDIYLCHATVADDKPISTVSSYTVTPTVYVKPALPSHIQEDGDVVIVSGDSLKGNLARPNTARVLHDGALVKEGTGSWYMQKLGWLACPVYMPTTDISAHMSDGYLHLWLYVEDASKVTGSVELTSAGKCDEDEICWSITKYITNDGWNEIWLPLDTPDSTVGTFDATKLNYFRIYVHGSANEPVFIVLDDIRIASLTSIDSFTVMTDEETNYLTADSKSYINTNSGVRYADGSAAFIYEYDLRDGFDLASLVWEATIGQQLRLSVSTDKITWRDVYCYTGAANDSGLSVSKRCYDLTSYMVGQTPDKVYIRIADAYPSSGWGGAVKNTTPVKLTVNYYSRSDTVADRKVETVAGSAIHTNTLGTIPGGLTEVVNLYMSDYEAMNMVGPLTTFQTNTYSESQQLPTDAVMAYSSSKEGMADIVSAWNAVSDQYELHLMTIINRTNSTHEYISSDPSRMDQAMKDKNGNYLTHSGTNYYMMPNDEWTEYVWEMVQIALDTADVKTIVFEEPDLWKASGYSECFKQEWVKYYGEPWEDQSTSPEAALKSQELKIYLLDRMMTTLITRIKEKSPDTKIYLATHSTPSYNIVGCSTSTGVMGIVSGVNQYLNTGLYDGLIGQTWSDTAGTTLIQDGKDYVNRFLAGYLGYASYVDSADDLDLYTLADPVGDGIGSVGRTEQLYYTFYHDTVVAQLIQPTINRYEVMPWSSRAFEAVSQDYRAVQLSVIKAQQEVAGKAAVQSAGTPGISYVLSDTMSYALLNNTSWAPSSNDSFMGLTLPLLSDGIPLSITAMENIKSVNDLKGINVLLLSFDGQKPMSEDVCTVIANWIKAGGVCLYVGGHDQYDTISNQWWASYGTPLQALLSKAGLSVTVSSTTLSANSYLSWNNGTNNALENMLCPTSYNSFYSYFTGSSNAILTLNGKTVGINESVGSGHLIALSIPSALFTTQENGTAAMRALVAYTCQYAEYPYESTSLMWSKRGNVVAAYSIGQKNVLTGKYIDLFDTQLGIHTHYVMEADSAALLYDITDVHINNVPRLVFSGGELTVQEESASTTRYTVVSPVHAAVSGRIIAPNGLYPQSITAYKVSDNSVVETFTSWDTATDSLLVRVYGDNDGVNITVQWGSTPVDSYELQKPAGVENFLPELGETDLQEIAANYTSVLTANTTNQGNMYDDKFIIKRTALADQYRYYCDGNREIVWCIDLDLYKNAHVILQLVQNYKLEVSADGDSWTEVQNFITVNGYRINASSNVYTFGIDSAVYAAGSDKLYIRLSNADPGKNFGGAINLYQIYYNTQMTDPSDYAPLLSSLSSYNTAYASKGKVSVLCNQNNADAEFIFLNNNAQADANCRYCDHNRELYLKFDLTKYSNAIVALQISQNYHVEVAYDNAPFVTVQDWLLAGNNYIASSGNQKYLILDSTDYAPGAEIMYVKLAAADTSNGYGARLASITVYYDK